MNTIWKFPLPFVAPGLPIKVPAPETLMSLRVAMQGGMICVWAEVNTEQEEHEHVFYVFVTGQEIPHEVVNTSMYVGLVQQGPFVWHVYEKYAGYDGD